MIFRQLFDSQSSTYTYLIGDEQTGEAALVDPVREQIERDLRLVAELGLRLTWVLETHVHADHVTAAAMLRERTGARTVFGQRGAACADRHVSAGDVILVGTLRVTVLDTPGHTDDSVSYVIGDRVLTGDALTIRGAGRTDFQNGDPRTLYRTITQVLFALGDDTLVYPGHDYKGQTVSTIGEERRHNPRLAGKSEDEFVAIMNGLGLAPPKQIAEAVPANRACGAVPASA